MSPRHNTTARLPSAPVTSSTPERDYRTGVLRDLAGLVLLVAGGAGTVVAAAAWDWRAGLLLVSVAAAYAGWRLATKEV